MKSSIFLDHAATTALDPRVEETIVRAMRLPLNASSVHRHGQSARALVEESRETIAAFFHVPPRQVVFTASATEANNLAIRGLCEAHRQQNKPLQIALSALEHSCVRETVHAMERTGKAELRWLPVLKTGIVDLNIAGEGCDLLCLMAVQNETGVIQPLKEAGALRRKWQNRWLCDVTQAVAVMEINPALLGMDFLSLSSHKIYGPPGVGALIGAGVEEIPAQITGGPQENEHRAGTQPAALIAGFAEALRLAAAERDARVRHLAGLRKVFQEKLAAGGVEVRWNGEDEGVAAGFLNFSVAGFSGADLAIALDSRGFSVSSGAACATGVMEVSPAMEAMFSDDPERAAGAVRITPGKDTSEREIADCAKAVAEIVRSKRTTGRFARR